MPDLETRREVIAEIRRFEPDLVLGPRLWDYHPDHRAAAQLMMDAMYLLTVPNVGSAAPHLRRMPVCALVADGFQHPEPFVADVAVDIDSVVERKIDALASQSQVYEWLPYNRTNCRRCRRGRRAAGLAGQLVPRGEDGLADRFRRSGGAYGAERAGRCALRAVASASMGAADCEETARLFPF
jgi:LmbE family N-acetylglucosaminyl deacetylase